MLDKVDLTKSMTKDDYRKIKDPLDEQLSLLQRECRNAKIPIIH